jgi:uncharacterized protein
LHHADLRIVLVSAALAILNGGLEELLWRGTYLRIFSGRPGLAWIYPSVGGALWHLAPLAVFPNRAPGGAASFVIVSRVVGLICGWVANRHGAIFWTTVAHVLFDFSGLGGRVYFQ